MVAFPGKGSLEKLIEAGPGSRCPHKPNHRMTMMTKGWMPYVIGKALVMLAQAVSASVLRIDNLEFPKETGGDTCVNDVPRRLREDHEGVSRLLRRSDEHEALQRGLQRPKVDPWSMVRR